MVACHEGTLLIHYQNIASREILVADFLYRECLYQGLLFSLRPYACYLSPESAIPHSFFLLLSRYAWCNFTLACVHRQEVMTSATDYM